MQNASASEGEPRAEDSNISHLSSESQICGIFGRSGSAPTGLIPNQHTRVRSAPPARARTDVGNQGSKVPSVAWIPSIPGRIVSGSSQTVPTLRIYSGTNSVASSRVPSSKLREPLPTALAGESKRVHANQRVELTDASSSSQVASLRPKEISDGRPCSSNISHSPRAKWKSVDTGWSRYSSKPHRARQASMTSRTLSPYSLTDLDGHKRAHTQQTVSQSMQTEDSGCAPQQAINVRTTSSQTGLWSRSKPHIAAKSAKYNDLTRSAGTVIQDFNWARHRLIETGNGERSFDLPAEFPNLCHMPVMKVQALVEDRDTAVEQAKSTAAECRHDVLASKAAERVQAEGDLKSQKGSLEGQVAMLTQAKEKLAHRVAQLTKDVDVAEMVAQSRLEDSQKAVQQANAFRKVIEAQNAQLDQKTKLLGSHWSEIQRLHQEKHGLMQQIEEFGSEDQVQDLKMRLQSMDQDAQALRNDAQAHGKKTALLKAQATALQMKLKEVKAENSALESAFSAAKSRAEEALIASRKHEAEAAALAHRFEIEKMRQADVEAQAWHAISRRNDIVQAYQPLLKRVHASESMQHDAQLRADSATQDLASLQRRHESTLIELRKLQSEHQRLVGIEQQHSLLLQQHVDLKMELKDVLSKTRPLRVLIAFKRHQVQALNHQLADLLELHADSAAKARTAQAPNAGHRSDSGHSQDLIKGHSDQGNDALKDLEEQVEHLQQKFKEANGRLDAVNADFAAAQIEKAGKEELLQEYINLTSQLTSKLEQSSASISNLHECKEQLEKELSIEKAAKASAECKLADECDRHQACQANCDKIQNDLEISQEKVKASLEESSLKLQALEQRAYKYEQRCARVVAAMTVQSDELESAMQTFRASCIPHDSGGSQLDSRANLFALVLDKLPADTGEEKAAADPDLSASESTASSQEVSVSESDKTVGALKLQTHVTQQICDVLNTLTELDLNGLIQKKDEQAVELGRRLKELEADSQSVYEESVRLRQELDSALGKLRESEGAMHSSEEDRHMLAEQLRTLQGTFLLCEQELEASVSANDARQIEVDRLQGQCDRLQLELESTHMRCQEFEAAARTTAGLMQSLKDNNSNLTERIAGLEAHNSELQKVEELMNMQLAAADAKLAEVQQHAKDREDAAAHLQGTCNRVEEELDATLQELYHAQQQEARANSELLEVKENLSTVQGMLQETQRSWLSPEIASSLRQQTQEWQGKHAKIEHRYTSLLDDFQHLSERKGAVDTERRRQHEYRHRVASLCAGLEQVQRDMADLQDRCCNVTQSGVGILVWAEKCMTFAEGMKQSFVDALVEHDAVITRVDLPGLHMACLSALRQRMNQIEATQPAGSAPQLMSVKKMEERVDQLRSQLATKQETEQTLRTTVQGLQKENITLQQNNAELRDELSVCGRTAAAAGAASAEARELRARVDQLTSMHRSLFGRMMRLAVLATEKQVGTAEPCSNTGSCDNVSIENAADVVTPRTGQESEGIIGGGTRSTGVDVSDGNNNDVSEDEFTGDAAVTPLAPAVEEPGTL